ncbi:MAG: hypothetical protein K0S45_1142 [Nitrospira sp.]|jgi:hypothetical protein|nr:hypothetical protein [Nitrospira sp.]
MSLLTHGRTGMLCLDSFQSIHRIVSLGYCGYEGVGLSPTTHQRSVLWNQTTGKRSKRSSSHRRHSSHRFFYRALDLGRTESH